jgi:hypothetical protein
LLSGGSSIDAPARKKLFPECKVLYSPGTEKQIASIKKKAWLNHVDQPSRAKFAAG